MITNPPFSQNYLRQGIPFPERFRLGFCPEGGKKADLMFVQHMVAVLRPGGLVVTVMHHGVLFWGGAEGDIRTGFLDEDLLDAVTGPSAWDAFEDIEGFARVVDRTELRENDDNLNIEALRLDRRRRASGSLL